MAKLFGTYISIVLAVVGLCASAHAAPEITLSPKVEAFQKKHGVRSHRTGVTAKMDNERKFSPKSNRHALRPDARVSVLAVDTSTLSPEFSGVTTKLKKLGFVVTTSGAKIQAKGKHGLLRVKGVDSTNLDSVAYVIAAAVFPSIADGSFEYTSVATQYVRDGQLPGYAPLHPDSLLPRVVSRTLTFSRVYAGRVFRGQTHRAHVHLDGNGNVLAFDASWPLVKPGLDYVTDTSDADVNGELFNAIGKGSVLVGTNGELGTDSSDVWTNHTIAAQADTWLGEGTFAIPGASFVIESTSSKGHRGRLIHDIPLR